MINLLSTYTAAVTLSMPLLQLKEKAVLVLPVPDSAPPNVSSVSYTIRTPPSIWTLPGYISMSLKTASVANELLKTQLMHASPAGTTVTGAVSGTVTEQLVVGFWDCTAGEEWGSYSEQALHNFILTSWPE